MYAKGSAGANPPAGQKLQQFFSVSWFDGQGRDEGAAALVTSHLDYSKGLLTGSRIPACLASPPPACLFTVESSKGKSHAFLLVYTQTQRNVSRYPLQFDFFF